MERLGRLNADGTVTVDGERYRVRDVGTRWIVERAADGREIGAFVIEGDAPREARARVVEGSLARSSVAAVAGVWCTPRSPLPLQ